jgi:hypothetical protein
MSDTGSHLPTLRADAISVRALVQKALDGAIRVPSFQRGLQWSGSDVVALFDSIYRGYPIGSLLFWEHPVEGGPVSLGPLSLRGREDSRGWSVVDGQQRLTALAVALGGGEAHQQDPVFGVYFDVRNDRVEVPAGQAPDEHWVPLHKVFDPVELGEYLHDVSWGSNRELTRRVHDAGARIREYSVPMYSVPTSDEEALREIFFRVNNSGKPLKWNDVHAALFATGRSPGSASDVAEDLAQLGMGTPNADRVLTAILSAVGLDPTRSTKEHIHGEREYVARAAEAGLPALRRVFDFLSRSAGVPHLRVLPRWEPVYVLTRFFALHPEPSAWNQRLLRRWLWRGSFGAGPTQDSRAFLRRSFAALGEDETGSALGLLREVPAQPLALDSIATAFDMRRAESRIALLGLASLRPRVLLAATEGAGAEAAGDEIDIAELFETHQGAAALALPLATGVEASTVGRRFLHPKTPRFGELLVALESDVIAHSHAVTPAVHAAMRAGDWPEAFRLRAEVVVAHATQLQAKHAEWGEPDRPSLLHLMQVDLSEAS